MKKIISTFLIAILFIGGAFALPTDAAEPVKPGFYSITDGQEKFYTTEEFKALEKAEKIKLFKAEWYMVVGPVVYPTNALLMTNAQIKTSSTPIAEFEAKHEISFSDIANGIVDDGDFDVISID